MKHTDEWCEHTHSWANSLGEENLQSRKCLVIEKLTGVLYFCTTAKSNATKYADNASVVLKSKINPESIY